MKAKYLLLLPILFFLQSCFVSEKSLYNEETNGKTTDAGTPAGFTGPIRCQRKTNLFCAATQPQLVRSG